MYSRQPSTADMVRTACDLVGQVGRRASEDPVALTVPRVLETVAALRELVAQLTLTCGQLAVSLDERRETNAVAASTRPDSHKTIQAAVEELRTMEASTRNLSQQLAAPSAARRRAGSRPAGSVRTEQ